MVSDQRRRHDMDEVESCLRELDVLGYTHIRGFLSPAEVATYVALVERHFDALGGASYSGKPARDEQDRFVYNLQNKDRRFLDPLFDPMLTAILVDRLNDPYYRFLPPDVPNYILSAHHARSSGLPLELHIDSFLPSPGDRTWSMQTGILLVDSTPENGCTTVVPGSHRSGTFTDRGLDRVESIVADAGDLVVWDSRLWHGTHANTSGQPRWSLNSTFTAWWVKPSWDHTRAVPQEIYEELDDRGKQLLGFCALPPKDEFERINTKVGYDALLPKVEDYR